MKEKLKPIDILLMVGTAIIVYIIGRHGPDWWDRFWYFVLNELDWK